MYQELLSNYRKYLKAGSAMRAELAKLLKGKQYLPHDVVNKLARVHESCYESCHAVMKDTGAWVFYTTDDPEQQTRANVHEAAKKQWQRTIAPHHDYERKEASVRNKKSVVDRYVDSIMKLTAAQRRAIAKAIA